MGMVMGERQGNYHSFVHLANMNIKQELSKYFLIATHRCMQSIQSKQTKTDPEKRKERRVTTKTTTKNYGYVAARLNIKHI